MEKSDDAKPDEITVCWGEEKVNVGDYSAFTAGPLFYKTTVRPGETPEQAVERAYEVVRKMGERHRAEKGREFLRYLREVKTGGR